MGRCRQILGGSRLNFARIRSFVAVLRPKFDDFDRIWAGTESFETIPLGLGLNLPHRGLEWTYFGGFRVRPTGGDFDRQEAAERIFVRSWLVIILAKLIA